MHIHVLCRFAGELGEVTSNWKKIKTVSLSKDVGSGEEYKNYI